MILADKIIEQRKRCGWSQEELAEQLGVSRQSISKWESAQSVPDINKVIAMSTLFGVSTDYLLRDEMESIQPSPPESVEMKGESGRWVSMEEANAFLNASQSASMQIAIGVLLCIISPILMILASTAGELGLMSFSVEQGTLLGVIVLLLFVAVAVVLFVKNGMQLSTFEYLEKEAIETEYGVSGMVREKRQGYEHTHAICLITGIVLCIIAVIPLFICALLKPDHPMLISAGVCVLLLLVAVGVFLIVHVSIIWGSYQKLLEEGDYDRQKKMSGDGILVGCYWAIVTAIYLAYSFWTNDWKRSWIIWPVAGVFSIVIVAISRKLARRAG